MSGRGVSSRARGRSQTVRVVVQAAPMPSMNGPVITEGGMMVPNRYPPVHREKPRF